MKVCIPTMGNSGLDEVISPHFGRAPTYTIVNTETMEVKVMENKSEHMGGKGTPPMQLQREGVDVLLCSGIGPRAIGVFEEMGIQVFVGINTGAKVREVLEQWKAGQLVKATPEHGCREHRH
ncbi:MAG: NifB/NifX family molybdenum-iron cluster-binding protein [Thermoplasmata archaeon]